MSFDDLIDKKKEKKEITDPKLKRLMRKPSVKPLNKEPPSLTVVKVMVNRPHDTLKLIVDGKDKTPKGEKFTIFKCNKCDKQFNHTQYQEAMGILPACPVCDK